ncbi:MAG: flavodoxin family protein [Deltaproteobacteria bacterium]|jgi:hypothetical protein|nr:flavodoxin family protein [Deltaproteobacteria bacterium]
MAERLVLHDLDPETAARLLPPGEAQTVFPALPEAKACAGCFGCWVRTPGACIQKDRVRGFAGLISLHSELAVVSRLAFGGFSPAVKRVIDRSIAHVLPFFVIKDGVMRHGSRSRAAFRLNAVFYGAGGDREAMRLAEKVVAANAANFGAAAWEARFIPGAPEAPLP